MIEKILRQRIISAVLLIGAGLIAIFTFGLYKPSSPTLPSEPSAQNTVSDNIELVSTNPEGLIKKQEVIILPNQSIEFTFNQPLENVPETKIAIEPTFEVKVELSKDRKTARLTPSKPFALGQGYTLFIKGDTKFEGKKQLGRDLDFHFSTISYKGV